MRRKTFIHLGLSRIEIIVLVILLFSCVILLVLPFCSYQIRKSRENRCKENLKQLGSGLDEYAKEWRRYFPNANGGGFLARLYQANIINDKKLFLCPSTVDKNSDQELLQLFGEDTETINSTSYAGRKNAGDPFVYPGIYLSDSETFTSLASDDFQGTSNHENGKKIIVLYFDGHVDSCKIYDAKENDYEAFATSDYDYRIADPLTN